jgi:hypothetical protein
MKNTFKNLQKVRQYLMDHNYKISKSQLYQHGKTGMIKPRQDGEFYQDDVDGYAADFLKTKAGGRPMRVGQLRRNEAEAAKLEAQARHWQLKADILAGQYVRKDTFERELAYRALVFKSDIQTFIRSQAGIIVEMTKGEKDRVPDLIEHMMTAAAQWLNRYAADREFKVPLINEGDSADIPDNE